MSGFTRAQVKFIRKEMERVLEGSALPYEFEVGNARFDSNEISFKMVVRQPGVEKKEESALAVYAKIDGVDPTKVGPKGEKLIEYHVRKPKYPYIYVTARGRRMKTSPKGARAMFGA